MVLSFPATEIERVGQEPDGGDQGQVEEVSTPGGVISGVSQDELGKGEKIEDQEHGGEKQSGRDVLNFGQDGQAGEHETNSGEHGPECGAERHPLGNKYQEVAKSGEVVQPEIDRRESDDPAADENTSRPGRASG